MVDLTTLCLFVTSTQGMMMMMMMMMIVIMIIILIIHFLSCSGSRMWSTQPHEYN
jgi:uncharacterized membrane protein